MAFRSRARIAAAAILIAGWCATLAISWPGHLSYDSIVQLHDGRMGFYHSWHPPVMAWMLGVGDAILPGTGLFVLFCATLLFAAMLSLPWLRSRTSWFAVAVAALCVALPQFLLYQTIVWKDVLFADSTVVGFVCLAHAEARWENNKARLTWIVAAFALLALASLTRQNGVIVLAFGGVALGIIAAQARGRKVGALYAGAALGGTTLLVLCVSLMLSSRGDHGEGPIAQLKLLRLYDLIGAVAAEPSLPLDRLSADAPELENLIRTDGVKLYSAQRNDTLIGSQALQNELSDTPSNLMAVQWYDLILHHPGLYLKVRGKVFRWVFLTPDIAACRPVFVGVEGPAGEMGDLGLAPRQRPRDLALGNYAKAFMGTPALSHPAFAILGLVTMILLLRRRGHGDIAMAFMLLGVFAFTASFFVVSIACDYRYLYALDLATLVALFYLALDPAYLFQVLAMWPGSPWVARSEARKS